MTSARRLRLHRSASHVDDTKWRELPTAVSDELPFPPPYQARFVLSGSADFEELEAAPSYYGDWARTPEASMGMVATLTFPHRPSSPSASSIIGLECNSPFSATQSRTAERNSFTASPVGHASLPVRFSTRL
ncbi:DUF6678 family protein [Rhizobium sp. S96]|uniref:DUF6678 family protein n=1 Tax=unclassified Rhizobium TaxID=2613769 RepID=UPI00339C8840